MSYIRDIRPNLAPAEQKVADYVLSHAPEVVYASVTSLAEACGVSESTVIRFCHATGFKGYQELKLTLARDLAQPPGTIEENIELSDDLPTVVTKVTANSVQCLYDTQRLLDVSQLRRAVDAIAGASRVNFYGVGGSGASALQAAYKFLRIGVQSYAYVDGHLQAMAAATLGPGDVAVGISQSGSTKDVVEACTRARESGATVIGITGHVRSPLAKVAGIVLVTATREAPLGSDAIRSTIAQLYVIDLLFTGVCMARYDRAMEYTGKTAEAVLTKLY
ncbi:MAG: MurR/RpiR family transcriptional regulator [Bacillota bacterium]